MSLALDIKFEGFNELAQDARDAGARGTDNLLRAALTNSASRVQSEQRQRAPHRTGTLQRSILVQIKFPKAEVTAQEKYAVFIEEGTGPFTIKPKTKKALFWPGAKHPVKMVRHPGIKAKPFFKPGYDAALPYVEAQFDKASELLTLALAGKKGVF